MGDRMVPWLPTSAMASFLNMGKKVRRNSVSKTEFRLFPSRTKMQHCLCSDNLTLYGNAVPSRVEGKSDAEIDIVVIFRIT